MSLCVYCSRRAGKRACPALGGVICPTCCGQHRGVEISCPIRCRYFKEHEGYQRARLAEEFHALWIAKTEPLSKAHKEHVINLLVTAEMLIYRFYRERGVGRDSDVLEAWETVRRRLSPVMIVEAGGTALANYLWEGLQEHLKRASLSSEEVLEGIETELEIFRAYADPAQPRRYLHGLFGHIERYFQLPEELQEAPSLIATPKIIAKE
jgi:hypothetical protein